jgi:signal transduction histidine kinase
MPVSGRWDLELALEPQPMSARLARHALASVSSDRLGPRLEHAVALLGTEVVANAVRHAVMDRDARIVLRARLRKNFARVEVTDPGAGFDPNTVAGGSGLQLLGELATRWGVECS